MRVVELSIEPFLELKLKGNREHLRPGKAINRTIFGIETNNIQCTERRSVYYQSNHFWN